MSVNVFKVQLFIDKKIQRNVLNGAMLSIRRVIDDATLQTRGICILQQLESVARFSLVFSKSFYPFEVHVSCENIRRIHRYYSPWNESLRIYISGSIKLQRYGILPSIYYLMVGPIGRFFPRREVARLLLLHGRRNSRITGLDRRKGVLP